MNAGCERVTLSGRCSVFELTELDRETKVNATVLVKKVFQLAERRSLSRMEGTFNPRKKITKLLWRDKKKAAHTHRER